MARIARIVAPGYPHHITQRGNHREERFFSDEDYQQYLNLRAEWCSRVIVAIWAYCLMSVSPLVEMIPAWREFFEGGS